MQNLKYKYRLYPTKPQETWLRQVLGSNRYVWNLFLGQEKEQHEKTHKFNFFNENSKRLTMLKKDLEWLQAAPSTSLQQTLKTLEQSMKISFKNKRGFPKFKSRKSPCNSFNLQMITNANMKENHFKCPNLGLIRCIFHRQLNGEIKSCQILKEANEWYVSFICKKEKVQKPIEYDSILGIDLNSHSHVFSDGVEFEVDKFKFENQKIKLFQRKLARKQKGSRNRSKASLQLQLANLRLRRKRLDAFHKLSKTLVTKYDCICMEDLNCRGIQQFNGKITQNNYMSGFRRLIEYKCELYGKHFVLADRYFPSTKTCSSCGSVKDMPLNERTYNCDACGVTLDRDLNSAFNLRNYAKIRQELPKLTPVSYENISPLAISKAISEQEASSFMVR